MWSSEDFPAIRCAWCPRREKWFSADNRRLFMFKVVAPLINLVELKVGLVDQSALELPRSVDDFVALWSMSFSGAPTAGEHHQLDVGDGLQAEPDGVS